MKRLLPYILPLLMMACASADDPYQPDGTEESAGGDETGEITVIARAGTLSRGMSNGWYNLEEYPVTTMYLTTYHRDRTGLSQYYFQDAKLTAEPQANSDVLWRVTGWYWPIQGEMQFLSYWSPKVYGQPEFKEILHNDDVTKSAWMVVNAQGKDSAIDAERYEGLDGKTDFLYIAEDHVPCPQQGPIYLTYRHGLAWITISLHAEVLDSHGVIDEAETQTLINAVKVNRVVIEDVSRKGTAYLVPGKEIAWVIPPIYIKDQVYTRPKTFPDGETVPPRGQYSRFTWYETTDGKDGRDEDDYITLSTVEQDLGVYTPTLPGEYTGNGLLIIPQHKTSITVYYQIAGGKIDGSDLAVAERYDCRDNSLEWEPGKRYHYDIIFRSKLADLHKNNIELIEKTYDLRYTDNSCYGNDAFGQLYIHDSSGNEFLMPDFILNPYHSQGSPFSDEMDYRDGGVIF